MPRSRPLISIVIPVLNESDSLVVLHSEIKSALGGVNAKTEIIFVDDGSEDNSYEIIRSFRKKDKNVRGIKFSRNFGHQAALWAGLMAAKGNAVVSIDADLQQPPSLIPGLIEKWQEGNEIVQTIRDDVAESGLFKRATSRLFYFVINKLGRVPVAPGAADFRLLDRKVVEELKKVDDCTIFLRGLIPSLGFQTAVVRYNAEKRRYGKSRYSLRRMVDFALSGIVSQSSYPLRLSFLLGTTVSFFSFLYACYALYQKFFTHEVVSGWTSLIISVLFLGGVQLTTIGVLGEYIGRVFEQVRRRPRYVITDSF